MECYGILKYLLKFIYINIILTQIAFAGKLLAGINFEMF